METRGTKSLKTLVALMNAGFGPGADGRVDEYTQETGRLARQGADDDSALRRYARTIDEVASGLDSGAFTDGRRDDARRIIASVGAGGDDWSSKAAFRAAVVAETGVPYRQIPFYDGYGYAQSGTTVEVGMLSDPEWKPKGPLEGKYLVHGGVALVVGKVFNEVVTPRGRFRLARVEVAR
jgi:hypothetical protein